jgi:pimeloyl-ACP methyl ester carboxylesterase
MRWTHCIRAVIFLAAAAQAGAQQTTSPAAVPSNFVVFLRGGQIGTEQTAVTRSADGWTISSSGRTGAPLELVTKNLQIRYTADWMPLELTLDATLRSQVLQLHIKVSGTTATTYFNNAGQATDRTDAIDPGAVLMPNPFFAAYEAVALKLKTSPEGSTITAYQGGPPGLSIRVGDTQTEQIQTVARLIEARRTKVTLVAAGVPELEAEIWADESGRLLRVSVPAQTVEFVRDDIASVSTRRVVISRPGDEQVRIPGNGFTVAGTVSKPAAASANQRFPVVVLAAGSGQADRDEMVAGIPVFGQLAAGLADAGFLVLRYDKRGIGQSGGRTESAGLVEFAEDLRAVVKYMAERKDADPKRVAVVGHSEGGAVALLAAAKNNRIGAVSLMATTGGTGNELILAQQKRLLDRSALSEQDKQAKVDLQKRIHEAVLSGKWEGLPADLRRQVDSPWFQSVLTFDPAKVVPQVRQPLLIVQGTLDTQVDPANADRLEALARARKRPATVDVVRIPGVNHLFVPATTGEVEEYATLKDRQISPALTSAIAGWLQTSLPPAPAR